MSRGFEAWKREQKRQRKTATIVHKKELVTQCAVRRESDEMVCGTCGLRWSIDEPLPPCPKGKKW